MNFGWEDYRGGDSSTKSRAFFKALCAALYCTLSRKILSQSAGRRQACASNFRDRDTAVRIERLQNAFRNIGGCAVCNGPDRDEGKPVLLGKARMRGALHVGGCCPRALGQGAFFGRSFDDGVAFDQRIGPNGMLGMQCSI